MTTDEIVRQFENTRIRSVWNAEEEQWYFSVVDIVGALTASNNPRNYWNMLKTRLEQEGSELYTNCVQLKMKASDGKMRKTDAANTEQILRIIQSIPSKKAEPFKLWLAKVGAERVQETIDPEAAIQRAMDYYVKKGYSEGWIRQRLLAIEIRMLAETTTTEISRTEEPDGFEESREVAKRGGAVAGNARKMIEAETGRPVVTSMNAFDFADVITGVIEASASITDEDDGEGYVE